MDERRGADAVADTMGHREDAGDSTWESFTRWQQAGEQRHRGCHRGQERLLGEGADVQQRRRRLGFGAGRVVMVPPVVKDPSRQTDRGKDKEEG